ncbi:hypothetical protein Fmac_032702 [Flemingia macrophylla]|uniref:Aminoacyl-transfer RNA synthetases class-II family profile domain-containing protein n=1 Tax=Flemingia macrophylla TaxID=520843 RepID=A0ABD1L5P8_9FABA
MSSQFQDSAAAVVSKKAAKKETAKQEKLRRHQEIAAAASAPAAASPPTTATCCWWSCSPRRQPTSPTGRAWRRSAPRWRTDGADPRQGAGDSAGGEEDGVPGDKRERLHGSVLGAGNCEQMLGLLVEIQVRKLYCISRAVPTLPINLEDAARSEIEIEKALQAGEQLVRVNQDTRLNFRVLDVRTPANQGIFRSQSHVANAFRQFLLSESFVEIHTPKLIAGSSEGGAAAFRLDYKGQPACLAQLPQLHKQMAICGDFGRVFEIGCVFRAEDSYTHRHLCEFTGLDVEMVIKRHYFEDVGIEIEPFGDLNTEAERKLGQLVLEKYGTEFYILNRYPLAVRPFYTMPCYDNPAYSNSFDVFIRGKLFCEEIISGAQRVHVPEFLEQCAAACGIDVKTISTYIDSFRYGAAPHGGFGVGLERVVMLFCGLNNIRKTSLFPPDPLRIVP